ncbi:hypothetical protein CW749_17555 [Vibrio sp. vnigr-6D03]|nr:hypothetical protein CW749_17555 [Vibrio sp. vnigr-6D03]
MEQNVKECTNVSLSTHLLLFNGWISAQIDFDFSGALGGSSLTTFMVKGLLIKCIKLVWVLLLVEYMVFSDDD